jgi:hypothetical protein
VEIQSLTNYGMFNGILFGHSETGDFF